MKLATVQFSQTSYYFYLFGPNISQHPKFNILSLCSSLIVTDQVSHPCEKQAELECCMYSHPYAFRSSSSSSLAQQTVLSQVLQKLLPAVPIPCSFPPISLPQLPGIFRHTIFPS